MTAAAPRSVPHRRQRLEVRGTVQGVGFRPFVQRLATAMGLCGWVANSSGGAVIEVQGEAGAVQQFADNLQRQLPALASIDRVVQSDCAVLDQAGFEIRPSLDEGQPGVSIPHDLAPCADCLREFNDPHNSRYQYPFISCTACGPRWSLTRRLPFDRANTSFAEFPPCAGCAAEYADPADRRCHHQGISCPACGPQLRLIDGDGNLLASGVAALPSAAARLRAGEIVALKSVGGFQLLVDACNGAAVARLRQRKQRPAKPLAVMFADLDQLGTHCRADSAERAILISPQRPIVLLPGGQTLPEEMAPGLATLGAMLPPSALHQALLAECQVPLVATSGNASGEPLCYRNDDAMAKLAAIADCFLLHDLAISQPLDDSVVRVIGGQAVTLRAGRGLAPYLVPCQIDDEVGLIAVGGHQKNAVAVVTLQGILASPHIGNLDSTLAQQRLGETVARLKLFAPGRHIEWLSDSHPDYGSNLWLRDNGHSSTRVQHHVAHFFSALAEHQHRGPALGVCWDGAGLGRDGTLWGGEFFVWDGGSHVARVAHLRPFPLPGGEAAIREPRRQALGLLWAMGGGVPASLQAAFTDSEQRNLLLMLAKNINSPQCTSVGRLVDAVAALLQVSYRNRFEADAAMQLEATATSALCTNEEWPFAIERLGDCRVIDWQPMIAALLAQLDSRPTAELAAIFHNTLAAIIAAVAADFPGLPVFLSGGVFQNKYLTEKVIARLTANGRTVLSHGRIPPNDGGLAVGQLYHALHCGGNELCV